MISVYFRKIINVGKTSDVGIVQKGLIVLWESLWGFFWGGDQSLRVGPKVHQTWELCVYLFPKAQTEVIGESEEARCPCGVLKWPRCLNVDS